MPEEGKELVPVQQLMQRRISRRGLVTGAIAAAGAVLVNRVLGDGDSALLEKRAKKGQALALPDPEAVKTTPVESDSAGPAFEQIFGNISGQDWQDAKGKVLEFKIGNRYGSATTDGRVDAVKDYEQHFEDAGQKFGIPKEILAGIALLESGGHPDVTSTHGARGLMQLLPEAAIRFGLKVELAKDHPDKSPEELIDERTDPVKSIHVAADYLATMRQEEFGGSLGISILGYYIGDGYTFSLLQEYFRDTGGMELARVNPQDPGHEAVIKTYFDAIGNANLNVHTLLTNPAVQQEIPRLDLDDDTNNYPYIAVACTEITSEN